MSELQKLTLVKLEEAVAGNAVAIRSVTRLQPAGGPGDKVFPPTYEGGVYATEMRLVDGQRINTVLLDSVQSQANRMEQALLDAYDQGLLKFPLLIVEFPGKLVGVGRVTALDAPHRIADAIFRDSLVNDKPFRESPDGERFSQASLVNATPLYDLCPTALIFGVWDSTGRKGGLGAKFARALVSEIVGFNAVTGVKTASRIDPLQIGAAAGPIYQHETDMWTLDSKLAVKKDNEPVKYGKKQKAGKPSAINHGNVTPSIVVHEKTGEAIGGGVTISHAEQTTVLSLPTLRRLHFPDSEGKHFSARDQAAQTVLASLALAAIAHHREIGYDLRSRCLLEVTQPAAFELVSGGGKPAERFSLAANDADTLFCEAVLAAGEAKFKWGIPLTPLKPSPKLVDLVKRSRELIEVDQEEVE